MVVFGLPSITREPDQALKGLAACASFMYKGYKNGRTRQRFANRLLSDVINPLSCVSYISCCQKRSSLKQQYKQQWYGVNCFSLREAVNISLKIVIKTSLLPQPWGQKEYLGDLGSLEVRTLSGDHYASTLRLKGIHRHQYCRGFGLKTQQPWGPSGTPGGSWGVGRCQE